jgi:hypothetical protein
MKVNGVTVNAIYTLRGHSKILILAAPGLPFCNVIINSVFTLDIYYTFYYVNIHTDGRKLNSSFNSLDLNSLFPK